MRLLPSARSAVIPGVSFQSRAEGVTMGDAWCICAGRGCPPALNFWFGLPFSPSDARGVDHVAGADGAAIKPLSRSSPLRAPEREVCPPLAHATVGVGQ